MPGAALATWAECPSETTDETVCGAESVSGPLVLPLDREASVLPGTCGLLSN